MTVPAKDVKVGWRVWPGTPNEWTVDLVHKSTFKDKIYIEIRERTAGPDSRVLYLRPSDPVDAAPPPRMITVPAMDDRLVKAIKEWIDEIHPPMLRGWLTEALAAHEREAT